MDTIRALRPRLAVLATACCMAFAAPPVLVAQAPPAAASDSAAQARLEVRKLELEIEELERESGALARTGRFLGLFAPVLALAGFWFTVYQFAKNQQKDRDERVEARQRRDEERLTAAVDQLLEIDAEKQPAIGKISFLLAELKVLVGRTPEAEPRITSAIAQFLHDDADFNQVRYVQLDLAALFGWPWYVSKLEDDKEFNGFLAYRYIQSLRAIHQEDPGYFESIRLQPDGTYHVANFTDEPRYLRFEALMRGFIRHLRHMSDPKLIAELMAEFQDALKNPQLAAQIRSQVMPAA